MCRGDASMDEAPREALAFPDRTRPMVPLDQHGQSQRARGRPLPRNVVRAIDFMRARLDRKVTMADLVAACGVADRTLQSHFRVFLGLPPLRYFRRLRLAAVRERLSSGANGASVSEIAAGYGFDHFGRFSAQYRRCFGELPSTTLRRARAADRAMNSTASESSGAGSHVAMASSSRLAHPSRDIPTIAVLPCRSSAAEPAHRVLAESLAEGIAAALGGSRSLAVLLPRSPNVARRDPRASARELGARYVLTGTIAQERARLRLVVCLVEAATAQHVWGDSFNGAPDNPFELQDRVIQAVFRAIPAGIRNCEIERARRAKPQDLDAHGLAMRAFPLLLASQPEAARRALELLHRAMEIDPDYALATALAAWGHGQLVMYNGTRTPDRERAYALWLAQRAAILDTGDPLVLTARCAVHTMAGEFDTADALVARALALDPSCGWAWGRSGWLKSYGGKPQAAIAHFRRALSLDPPSAAKANSYIGIGSAHFDAGRYDVAATWMRTALLEQPNALWANRTLSVSYARLGERRRALQSLEALRRYCPDLTVGRVVTAIPFRPDYLNRLAEGLNALGLPS
jgi:TolB-like protein/AraC-like DNA-binding protein